MRQFADYGFPKAHSVAYAYLAFQTAYLKRTTPNTFTPPCFRTKSKTQPRYSSTRKKMRGQGIELLPPDVNESDVGFTPLKGAIRYGLAAIKELASRSVSAIIRARESGPFHSMTDFAERLQEGCVNKRVLEGLVCSGAFDSVKCETPTNLWRAALCGQIDSSLAAPRG